jgi:hypothetical protein
MKKIFLLPGILIFTLSIVLFAGCSKDIEGRTDNAPALHPSNTDLNAGTWKPVLLTSPDEFAVVAPIATTAPDYIAQINEIKTFQADLSNDEKALVKYWSAGAVLRWNEIFESL